MNQLKDLPKLKLLTKMENLYVKLKKNYYTNNLDENTNAENVEKVLYAFLNSSELKPKGLLKRKGDLYGNN